MLDANPWQGLLNILWQKMSKCTAKVSIDSGCTHVEIKAFIFCPVYELWQSRGQVPALLLQKRITVRFVLSSIHFYWLQLFFNPTTGEKLRGRKRPWETSKNYKIKESSTICYNNFVYYANKKHGERRFSSIPITLQDLKMQKIVNILYDASIH